ncbi:Crp/Fnr family transcriptional regulator [Spirochaetia bacterium]|nr:Crp/Fnr family transcriptional regulator [Spirochaetia bacterium]
MASNAPLQLSFVKLKKDSYIVLEGKQNADRFFIIREGQVRISKEVEVVAEEGGNILGPGDFFAVVSTMSSHSHIETAQAVSDVTLISVQKDQYSALIQQNNAVAMKIILQFSQRMRYLDEALSTLALKNSTENGVSHLFNVGEYYANTDQYNHAHYVYSRYLELCPQGEYSQPARQRMVKIAPFVKAAKQEVKPGESSRKYARDTMIFAEGEPGNELYIIQSGAVKIAKIAGNNEILLAVLKPGDIFGEMALLESKPRTACALAYEDSVLLTVSKANFARMAATQPQIIARLTVLLAERIWLAYKQLANTLIENPLGRIYDALLLQLEKSRVNMETEKSHSFDFGLKELINMVGLSPDEGALMMRKIMENRTIQIVDEKILALDIQDIVKQASLNSRPVRKSQ